MIKLDTDKEIYSEIYFVHFFTEKKMPGSILIYFPCISKSITFPLSRFVQQLIDNGHEVRKTE